MANWCILRQIPSNSNAFLRKRITFRNLEIHQSWAASRSNRSQASLSLYQPRDIRKDSSWNTDSGPSVNKQGSGILHFHRFPLWKNLRTHIQFIGYSSFLSSGKKSPNPNKSHFWNSSSGWREQGLLAESSGWGAKSLHFYFSPEYHHLRSRGRFWLAGKEWWSFFYRFEIYARIDWSLTAEWITTFTDSFFQKGKLGRSVACAVSWFNSFGLNINHLYSYLLLSSCICVTSWFNWTLFYFNLLVQPRQGC